MKYLNEIQKLGLLFFLTMMVYQGGGGLFIMLFSKYLQDMHAQILVSQFFILLFPAIWYFRSGENIIEKFRLQKLDLSLVPLLILATALLYPFLSLINMLSSFVVQSQSVVLGETMMTGGVFWNLLIVALVPCMVEELVCRGMLLSGYRQISTWTGILLSAFLFGCMHMNLNQFLYTFVFGIFLALMVEVTGSLFASVICHFTLNGSSVLLVNLFADKLTSVQASQGAGSARAGFIFFAMMALVGLFLQNLLIKQIMAKCGYDKERAKETFSIRQEKGKLLGHIKESLSAGLMITVIICFLFMIVLELKNVL